SRTARRTLIWLPYPLSPSATTGIFTASAMAAAFCTISVMVTSPTSGTPTLASAVPPPVMYTASNPARSTSFAPSGSNAPGAISAWSLLSNSLSLVVGFMGSLGLDAHCLNELSPLRLVLSHERGEALRRSHQGFRPDVGEFRVYLGVLQRVCDLRVQAFH